MRRTGGAILVLTSVLPLYRALRRPETGLAGTATAGMAGDAAAVVWAGFLFALAIGIVAGRAVSPVRLDRTVARLGDWLERPDTVTFAAACGVTGGTASLLIALFVFNLEPALVDATAQLTHARYLADGLLAAPADTLGFFRIQQTVSVPDGWMSQYPPGHVIALAAGMSAGMPWLIGPAMLAIALYFTARAVDTLLPDQRRVARASVLLAALSPFMLAHAATYMSHTTAAACLGVALYGVSRGRRAWYALAGLAVGAAFATRPLTGVTIGVILAIAIITKNHDTRARIRGFAAFAGGTLPGVLFVALYNLRMFGAVHRFGYDAALGPSAGPGFGIDPWGNTFGFAQAIAYTSAELIALSLHLLEAPFPWVALVGLFLLLSGTLTWAESLLFAFALIPLFANLTYWHHGLFMGPRMLNEYGIIWCVTIALAAAGLVRASPVRLAGRLAAYSPRSLAAGMVAGAVALSLLMIPQRLRSLSQPASLAKTALRDAPPGTLVFVHGSWADRVAMQLAARGWRLDEVETALRQNSTCAAQQVVDRTSPRESLSLVPRATDLPQRVQLPRGSAFRVVPGETWTAECARQVASDTMGIVDPASLVWRVSSRNAASPVFVRDLGPELNAELLRYDEETAVVLARTAGGSHAFIPYRTAMEQLWTPRP